MSRHSELFREMSKGANPLGLEILQEAASSLSISGERLQKALDALNESDPGGPEHEERLKDAAEKFWGYAVQRELLGLLDTDYIARAYQVPPEVRSRAGI